MRLVAVDMDGTLLSSTGEVLPGTRAVFATARGLGVRLAIASGRAPHGLRHRLRRAGLDPADFLLVGTNGGIVEDGASGEVMLRRPLPRTLYAELVTCARELPVVLMVPEGGRLYVEGTIDHPLIAYDAAENGASLHRTADLAAVDFDPLKLQICADPEVLARVVPTLVGRFGDAADLAYSAASYFEANAAGVSKGSTLELVCDQVGLGLESLVTFGDNGNDLTMIQVAGLGVAMGNAIEEVKQAADLVTTSHDDEGIARVLGGLFAAA